MNTPTGATANEQVEIAQPSRTRLVKPTTRRRWWLWLLVLGAALIAVLVIVRWQTQRSAAAKARETGPPTVPVVVASARKGEIPVYLNALGSAAPFNTVTVRSRIDGQLLKVNFQEGQFVRQGDSLAEIDPKPFEVQLDQARGQLARDEAQLANAKLDLARYQTLSAQGVIPRQQLDTQAASVRQFDGVIQADQAQINNAKLQITYCHITAPLAGRVGLRLADVGNMIHANDTNGLVVIAQIQPIAVLFTIPEDSLAQVLTKIRSGEHLMVEAYDRGGQTKIADGRVETIDNEIDPATGTSRLKAIFDNKSNALFPNQFVNVRLLVEIRKDRILIPAVAIQRGPQGTYVYVVKEDQTADVRPVTVGTIEAAQASVESGLSEGERVVVDGVDKLRAGSKVKVNSEQGPAE
ncbi:MAG TPA: MdtA/MuxA family multidrug efflux RND transporter periplasmic adaptor subunit [Blastocatellia bacterium]|nr:MdtA/MuxA family multidrug efflux RND transporter periplasmic adaptor subunit [Blastocatellia bacterium]